MKQFFLLISFLFSSVAYSAAGQWEEKKFQDLVFEIYVPKKISSQKAGLMLTLHGCSQRAVDFAQYGNWQEASEKYGTIIIAPQVPKGGVKMGCWDYYGSDHSVTNRHHQILFQFLAALLKEPSLKIDPRRVYVSGLSSGGGEALLLGCLRPDVFTGVGLNSSPAIPSEAHEISNPRYGSKEMMQLCQKIAGNRSSAFETQMTSVLVADRDFIVSNQHSEIIVDAMTQLSRATTEKKINMQNLPGENKAGEGWLYSRRDGGVRVSYIINQGLGHNWAAGGGKQGGAFITRNSINYPLYLLSFFETQNPRLKPKELEPGLVLERVRTLEYEMEHGASPISL